MRQRAAALSITGSTPPLSRGPPQGYYGNAPVAPIYNPGQNNFDITLMKKISRWGVSSDRYSSARSSYNAFNHTHFASVDSGAVFDPQGNQINGQFGTDCGDKAPRVIQFSLRLEF